MLRCDPNFEYVQKRLTQKVSDGSQPSVTFDLSPSESAGFRPLERPVGQNLS